MSIWVTISHLHYVHPRLDQHVTVTKVVTPSKPAEGEFLASYLNVVGISFSPVKPRLLWWICNEHNLQDVILVLYLSAFVCKLSIMDKKNKPACIRSWFCHEMTLPNVWYCFLYLREKKYTAVDALRLCYKSFFWTAFCIFEHNCIACLAAVIDSRSVTWCEFRSPLLFCFLSNTQALDCIILVYWMYDCKCIISNNNFVLCQTGKSVSLLLLILFFHNLLKNWNRGFFPQNWSPVRFHRWTARFHCVQHRTPTTKPPCKLCHYYQQDVQDSYDWR